jgi:hypothetical protein
MPPPIPPPPPINLKFFGFANRPGETKKVFLSQGEDIFIAGEGDIVDRRYRVLHISANSGGRGRRAQQQPAEPALDARSSRIKAIADL